MPIDLQNAAMPQAVSYVAPPQSTGPSGVSTGSPGSPNSNASYLQALGLNSLNMTNLGEQNLHTATQNLPGGAISQNPGFYTNPGQVLSAAGQNAQAQNESNNAAAGLAAAKAGFAAGGAGGGGTSFGPLPPTPSTGASGASTPAGYGPPVVGYGSGVGSYDQGTVTDMNRINQILSQYSSTVDPSTAPGGETSGSSGFYAGGSPYGSADTNSGENSPVPATAFGYDQGND